MKGAFFALGACAALTALAFACDPPIDTSTPCGQARVFAGQCGVMLPLLDDALCTGTAEAISMCILTAHGSCDALAAIGGHLDRCVPDGGSPLPSDLPEVRAGDGGTDAATTDSGTPDAGDAGPNGDEG